MQLFWKSILDQLHQVIDREDGLCPVCTKQTDLTPNLPSHSIHFRTMWETKPAAL